ncbi:helix-turn-helix transcriptional regulator [Oceanibaculum indicum]|uniref:Prophage regulatory protein n=1 Tax=Oceanibaculum indicum TaxID=526216 RepID=A0A420WRG0_9PROT|nr:prophage regulatory protein [Oceanibaculum indicum]
MSHETRLLRRKEVEDMTGLSRSPLYREIQAGRFPRPVKVGAHASRWVEAEVRAWVAERVANREAA